MPQTKIWFTLILALCLCFSLVVQATTKQEMGIVINLAGKQRMLTQKMTKEILLIAKGIDTATNKVNLQKTVTLFDKTLKGLLDGNAELGLPKTKDIAIVKRLNKIARLWKVFYEDIAVILKGNISQKVLENVARQNFLLQQNMNKAVRMYAQTTDSNLKPAMAITINLAGKQRMLTQKMTKELLLVANGISVEENKVYLKSTSVLFERTLKGLFDGDVGLALPATKDPAIRTQLEAVQKLWQEYKPILDIVDISDVGLAKAAQLNLALLKQMNKVVDMYEQSIK